MHPLDNVIWQALTTRQTQFAEICDPARRFLQEVTLLCALEEPSDHGYEALGRLVGEGGTGAIFLDTEYEARAGWEFVVGAPLLQMVCENSDAANAQSAQVVDLGLEDSVEMQALTALTKPGPFGPRTHELGNYVGIRVDGVLVSMAGERLKVPEHTEVSAVCTHPDFVGHGYASVLMSEIIRRIQERGETPFLHVREDNTRAIAVYEKLGFTTRKRGYFAVLRKTNGATKRRANSNR